MNQHEPRFVRVAAAVGDPARARMLAVLLSGSLATAGELAHAAGVAPSTASGHLQILLDAGLVLCEPRGRHRYFRLADADVAHALEALALVGERGQHERSWDAPGRQRLRTARTCYGHLAGRLGVALSTTMIASGWIISAPGGFALTQAGRAGLQKLGVDLALMSGRRTLAYSCLDWSERREHLAGPLATVLLDHFLASSWLRRVYGERSLELTPEGRRRLAPLLPFELLSPLQGRAA